MTVDRFYLSALRTRHNLTKREVAALMGCRESTYHLWEIRQRAPKSLEMLRKFADAFALNLDEAIRYFDVPHTEHKPLENPNVTDLSRALGTSRWIIYLWQRGTVSPSLRASVELAQLMGVSLDELYRALKRGDLISVKTA